MLLAGCFKITAVDGTNKRITITSPNVYSSAASGSVTGTVTIVKTTLVIAANQIGVSVLGQYTLGLIDQLVIEGVNNNDTGFSAQQGGSLLLGGHVGVANCNTGLFAAYGGSINVGNVIVSSIGSYGLFATCNGSMWNMIGPRWGSLSVAASGATRPRIAQACRCRRLWPLVAVRWPSSVVRTVRCTCPTLPDRHIRLLLVRQQGAMPRTWARSTFKP